MEVRYNTFQQHLTMKCKVLNPKRLKAIGTIKYYYRLNCNSNSYSMYKIVNIERREFTFRDNRADLGQEQYLLVDQLGSHLHHCLLHRHLPNNRIWEVGQGKLLELALTHHYLECASNCLEEEGHLLYDRELGLQRRNQCPLSCLGEN